MVCHEMAFLPPPHPSDHHHHHHQYLLHQQMMNHPHHQMTTSPGEEDLSDDGSQLVALGEKKKRLSLEQVRTLEKNFEVGNKLEPERKQQLAKALGLQPRQVAIWFQNRRARSKTKQLEKDFNILKTHFDALRSHNDSLLATNKKLHDELVALKNGATNPQEPGQGEYGSINLNTRTTMKTKSYCNWSNNGSEISSDINLGISTTSHPEEISPSSNDNKLQFPAPQFIPTSLTDLLTGSSKPSDHPHQQIQDDTFCTLFSGAGASAAAEQPPFWAWAPSSLN